MRNFHNGHWFNAPAARTRLTEIDCELERLRSERALLVQVLGQVGKPSGRSQAGSASQAVAAALRQPARRRPSMLDLLARIMSGGPAAKGWAVGELRDQLVKLDPVRASAANASALISSALVQALRAKTPRFIGSKGGRGHAREYRLLPGVQ